jgi:hypothetical protein
MTLRKIAVLYDTSHCVIRNNLIKYGFTHKSRQNLLDETFFEKLDTLEKQYFLGWIYSDGCVFAYEDKQYYGLAIKLQERDKYILEYFKEILGSDSNIRLDCTNGGRYSQFKVGSKKMYDDLLQYGLMPRKTHLLKYPRDIITDHRPFILGMFEGDGSIYINKHKMPSFHICGTKDMVTEIRDILASELNLYPVPVRKHKNSYRFMYEGTNPVQKIGKWLYSWDPPVFLKRKKDLFDQLYTMPKYEKIMLLSNVLNVDHIKNTKKERYPT